MIFQPSLTQTLRAMKPGSTERIDFDLFQETTIRYKCSVIGKARNLAFSVHKDRINRIYTIACDELPR